jgi:uncharacterized protein YdaU (DUF1376 family)
MSKAADTWMPLYIGDYLADTMHLSAVEHGAYLLLLMHSWRNGPLPNDDRVLAGIARVEQRAWAKGIGSTVKGFFTKGADGRLHQKRLDAERERVEVISDKRRSAAASRHANRSTKEPEPPPDGGSKSNANAHANAVQNTSTSDAQHGANGLQNAGNHSHSHKEEDRSAKPDSSPPVPAREAVPLMPSLSDPHHRWAHLGEKDEIDGETGKRHPVVAGWYLDDVCRFVCEAAGINDANFRGDWRPVIAWLKDGLDPHEQILPAIRQAASRANYRASDVRSLAYFDAAVRQQRRVA